jgi:dTDP-4-amino-4,6-dideoxygalactose transaminase
VFFKETRLFCALQVVLKCDKGYNKKMVKSTRKGEKFMEIKPFENKIWLASPTMHGEEEQFVHEAFVANWITTAGENINRLEADVCDYMGCKHAVALASGTSALHLAVKLAGVVQGDQVLCTDMTFAATVNPVAYEKAELIFVDSEYDTWNMDPAALEKAFENYPNAKAVIVVNLYGVPAKLDEILEICKKHHAVLIEDAAESMGATYKGQQTGTFGAINCISFNGNKIITGSSGGMLLTDDKEIADHARKLSTQARENAPWYQHEEYGYNYRMSNIVAGVARGQMLHLDEHVAQKKRIYEKYLEGLQGLPVKMNPYIKDIMEPNFWLSCMIIDNEAMCEQTRTATEASYVKEPGKTCPTEILEKLAMYNVEARPIWKPMHLQPIYADCDYVQVAECGNVSEDIFERGLCLPSDIKMTEEQQEIVIKIIRSCFE